MSDLKIHYNSKFKNKINSHIEELFLDTFIKDLIVALLTFGLINTLGLK